MCRAIILGVVIAFAQSARRHKIGQARVRHVVKHPFFTDRVPAPPGSLLPDDRLVFLGDDQTGRPLEVMAVELDDGGLLGIHAMDLRAKYQPACEEGKNARQD